MLDYTSLFALAAVVREGSFERAARSLNVTPSAVSQRIRLLEERVGCALVVRGQPCQATETGRRLCHHADRVRLMEHELQTEVPGLAAEHQPPVSVPIAVNADSIATWFPDAMAAFAAKTNVLMEVAVDDEGYTADWLRRGTVLAAVTASDHPPAGCNGRPLGAMRYAAVASPGLVNQYFAQGVSAHSLAKAPSLVFSTKDDLQQRWAGGVCGQPVALRCHTLPSPQAFVAAALAGMGWALHPLALIREHLASGRLVELVPGATLDVPLYWQEARATSVLLRHLTDEVVNAAHAWLVQPPAP